MRDLDSNAGSKLFQSLSSSADGKAGLQIQKVRFNSDSTINPNGNIGEISP